MMYSQKLVASVKAGGKIMREQCETVFLPFGSEYSLLLKNLNSRRALVNIEIDGENIAPGGLVINANQTIDLERFIVDGDLDNGPRFKFIEKTEEISDFRGDRISDGLIRITFQYEKQQILFGGYYRHDFYGTPQYDTNFTVGGSIDGISAQTFTAKGGAGGHSATRSCSTDTPIAGSTDTTSDAGITVKGSESNQKFKTTTMNNLEREEHVIVLNIRGKVGEEPIQNPVTVDTKIQCQICGKSSKSSNKFCSNCGNNLTYQY